MQTVLAQNPSIMSAEKRVIDVIRSISIPGSARSAVHQNWVRGLHVTPEHTALHLELEGISVSDGETLRASIAHALTEAGFPGVTVSADHAMIGLDVQQSSQGPIETGAAHIIAVASGKGGVGKSTVAANLAVALAQQGYAVGLADTDIYGPSVPTMFDVEMSKPRVDDARRIIPVEKYGVKLLSMGFLVDPDKAVIWRGPMVSSAVKQFLGEAAWGDLDFLVLDLPPGTGDIQLTLVQSAPLSGAVIVSTPQKVALADAKKGIAMFEQVDVPVLGVVENMAYFAPPDQPDRRYYLFGEGGAKALAATRGVPVLGEIPLEMPVREQADAGRPIVLSQGDPSPAMIAFSTLATNVADATHLHHAKRAAQSGLDISYE